ncbi:MAG: hypothetical protein HYZ53_30300 [Planctomycetes bacterium]|nr:hypothetical protein [Planctomycetota bacterium]
MSPRNKRLPLLAAALLLALPLCVSAQEVVDRQRMFDVDRLSRQVEESLAPFQEKVLRSAELLKAKQRQLREIAGSANPSPAQLESALNELAAGYDAFLSGWDTEVVAPVRKAEREIAAGIEKTRAGIADPPAGGVVPARSKELQARLGHRMSELAQRFKQNPDPAGRQRLAAMFLSLKRLRDLADKAGGIPAGADQDRGLARLLEVLTRLSMRISSAGLALETAGVYLAAQRDAFRSYGFTFHDFADAQKVGELLRKLGADDDPATGLPASIGSVASSGEHTMNDLNGLLGSLLEDMENGAGGPGAPVTPAPPIDPALEREIERSAAPTAPASR